ncbi:hypothetical protein Tco_0561235 [Tanacetum coccineum]
MLYVLLCYVLFITAIGFKGELHENTEVREILFLYCYAFSVSLLLTPLCCDDKHDVTPRVSVLEGCDTFQPKWFHELKVSGIMSPSKRKFRWGIMRSTGIKRYIDPISGCKIWRTNRKCRIPIDLYPCKVEESMTMKKVGEQTIGVIRRRRISKEGNVSRFQEYHTSDEEEEEFSEHPSYNKYGFMDHP